MRTGLTDEEFIEAFKTLGPQEVSRRFKLTKTNVYKRRRNLELKYGIQIAASGPGNTRIADPHPDRVLLTIKNGIVLIGSDAHYWPDQISTAH